MGDASEPGGLLADRWEWDGTSWTQFAGVTPPTRANHVATFDAIRRQLVMFGGLTPLGNDSDQTWALTFGSSLERVERCILPTDDFDADGLAGCADPDCWGRCAPLCPPGVPCPVTAPHCGAG